MTAPTCAMAEDPDWPAKPRICPHTAVLASGGTCADQEGWAEVIEQRRREWEE